MAALPRSPTSPIRAVSAASSAARHARRASTAAAASTGPVQLNFSGNDNVGSLPEAVAAAGRPEINPTAPVRRSSPVGLYRALMKTAAVAYPTVPGSTDHVQARVRARFRAHANESDPAAVKALIQEANDALERLSDGIPVTFASDALSNVSPDEAREYKEAAAARRRLWTADPPGEPSAVAPGEPVTPAAAPGLDRSAQVPTPANNGQPTEAIVDPAAGPAAGPAPASRRPVSSRVTRQPRRVPTKVDFWAEYSQLQATGTVAMAEVEYRKINVVKRPPVDTSKGKQAELDQRRAAAALAAKRDLRGGGRRGRTADTTSVPPGSDLGAAILSASTHATAAVSGKDAASSQRTRPRIVSMRAAAVESVVAGSNAARPVSIQQASKGSSGASALDDRHRGSGRSPTRPAARPAQRRVTTGEPRPALFPSKPRQPPGPPA